MRRKVVSIDAPKPAPKFGPEQKEKPKRLRIPYPHTPIPSKILRDHLHKFTPPELACYLYIADKTRGYRKEWESIPLSWFSTGQPRQSGGEPVDHGTGFKRNAVRNALMSLYTKGLIRVKRCHRKTNQYALTLPEQINHESIWASKTLEAMRANRSEDFGLTREQLERKRQKSGTTS